MEEIKLDVQIRNQIGSRKIRRIRRENYIPAVVYGAKKDSSLPIQIDRKVFQNIMRHHQGGNVVFHLHIYQGEKKLKDYPAIVKEEQVDPVNDQTLHIDFKQISLTEKITVKVSIVAKGEAIGVKQDGGSLEHTLWEIEVICLPTQIPPHLEVDVSSLKIHDTICVKDIALPPGVTTKMDPEAVVLSIIPPMKEEVVAPEAAEGAPTEPEVIKEKPKEKKEEAASEKKPEGAKAEGK